MKKLLLILTTFLILTLSLSAMESISSNSSVPTDPKEAFFYYLHNWDGNHYQQTELLYEDPKGDAILINLLNQVPMKLINALTKKNYREEDINKEEELKESADYIIGKKVPVNPRALVNKFVEIIRSHPEITPTAGIEHKWSNPAKRYMWYGFFERAKRFFTKKTKDIPTPLLMRTKFFLCLACGYTSKYTISGKEMELENCLLENFEDKTVTPADALEQSYIINKGNIYLTMLTLENMLAKDPYKANRGDSPIQRKLIYLRNDSRPDGDNYGAWYHFFGIAGYGYVRNPLTSRFVAEVESLGSIFLEGFDRQEDYINRYGSKFGSLLRKMVKERWWEKEDMDLSDVNYMTNDEFDYNKEYEKSEGFFTKMKKKVKNIFKKKEQVSVADLSEDNAKFTLNRFKNHYNSYKNSIAEIQTPKHFTFKGLKKSFPQNSALKKKRFGFIETLKQVAQKPALLLHPSQIASTYNNQIKDFEIVEEFEKNAPEMEKSLEKLESSLETIISLKKEDLSSENQEKLRNAKKEFVEIASRLEVNREQLEEMVFIMNPELKEEEIDHQWIETLYQETLMEKSPELNPVKQSVENIQSGIDESRQRILKLYEEEISRGNILKAQELLKQIEK